MRFTQALLFSLILIALFISGAIIACGDDDDEASGISDDDTDDDDDDSGGDDDSGSDDDDSGLDDDDDTGCSPVTVEDVCDFIFANSDDNWGWTTLQECYEGYMTGCADESGYFACVCECVEPGVTWDEFSGTCEPLCWNEFCVE